MTLAFYGLLASFRTCAQFPSEGYKILKQPENYRPVRTPARKLMATPTPAVGATPLYHMPSEQSNAGLAAELQATPAGIPFVKPEDYQYFAPLLKEDDEIEDMTAEEVRIAHRAT